MAQVTRKLTQMIYVGTAPLTLSTLPTAAKTAIKLIRQVNAGGTGYASWSPLSGVNQLQTVYPAEARAQVIVETNTNTPNFTLPDFALAPTAASSSDTIQLSGPAGETTTLFAETTVVTAATTVTAVFNTGAGTVQLLVNGVWTNVGSTGILPAGTSFQARVQHPNNAAFTATLTLAY